MICERENKRFNKTGSARLAFVGNVFIYLTVIFLFHFVFIFRVRLGLCRSNIHSRGLLLRQRHTIPVLLWYRERAVRRPVMME